MTQLEGVKTLIRAGGKDENANHVNDIYSFTMGTRQWDYLGKVPNTNGIIHGEMYADGNRLYVHVGQNLTVGPNVLHYASNVMVAKLSSLPLKWSKKPIPTSLNGDNQHSRMAFGTVILN